LAYTVIFAVTVVAAVNCVPPPFCPVYQPPKVYPLLAGSLGILEAPIEAPLFTVRVCAVGIPPSALKITVYWEAETAVHLAYTVIFAVTVVAAVNCVPPPFMAVYQPPKVYPLLAGSLGILEEPIEAPLLTVFVCVAGVPPSALKVTVYWEAETAVHLAYTIIFPVTAVVAINCVPPPFCPVYQPPKVYPLLPGSLGILDAPIELPLFTTFVCMAGVPPSALKITVYWEAETAVHLAYTIIFPVTAVVAINCVPPPFCPVYQPPKMYPLLAGSEGILDAPIESPLFTVFICAVGIPPSA
jgi:hypothetical protein